MCQNVALFSSNAGWCFKPRRRAGERERRAVANELDARHDRVVEVVQAAREHLVKPLRLRPAPRVLDVEEDAKVVGRIEPVSNEEEVEIV